MEDTCLLAPRENVTTTPNLVNTHSKITIEIKQDVSNHAAILRPTLEQLYIASNDELREMVKALVGENKRLELLAFEGRIPVSYNIEKREACESMTGEPDSSVVIWIHQRPHSISQTSTCVV
jgi:hypothetical protein